LNLRHTNFALAFVLLSAAACNTPAPEAPNEAQLPDAGADGVYRVDFPQPTQPETRHLLMTVSEDLTRHCEEPPHFRFDETEPRAQARVELAFVTQCLKESGLDEHQIFVVGHADRRGTDEYNLELALDRAREVKAILVDQGIPSDRLLLGTMGEAAAVGGEGQFFSHGYDRRVDLVVVGKDASPEASGVVPYIPVDES
jgi:outer membrane protein OmpA-like peptidoglycan-associated protein